MCRQFMICGVSSNAQPITALLVIGKQILGRSSSCDIVLEHESVSRTHAALVVDDKGVAVIDLGSRNGTFVDGRRVQGCRFSEGQSVSFGKVAFFLVALNAAGEKANSSVETDQVDDASEIGYNETGAKLGFRLPSCECSICW